MLEELTSRRFGSAAALADRGYAEKLGVQQPAVSTLERQTDLRLSTLGNYIAAVGGELEILARFPDRDPGASPSSSRSSGDAGRLYHASGRQTVMAER